MISSQKHSKPKTDLQMNNINEINEYTLSEIIAKLDGKLDQNICDVPPTVDDGHLPAAVMILLVRKGETWNIFYTQRTDTVRDHKGQVSFPGGAWESEDPCLKDTALRETFEEVGIIHDDIQVFGSLQPIRTISNYFITPFIGTFPWPYPIQVEKREVENAFLIPISWLMDETNREEREFVDITSKIHRDVTFYREFDGHILWGITAWLTIKFLELLK